MSRRKKSRKKKQGWNNEAGCENRQIYGIFRLYLTWPALSHAMIMVCLVI